MHNLICFDIYYTNHKNGCHFQSQVMSALTSRQTNLVTAVLTRNCATTAHAAGVMKQAAIILMVLESFSLVFENFLLESVVYIYGCRFHTRCQTQLPDVARACT